MRVKSRGFLLFTFAFSSVLSSAEVSEVAPKIPIDFESNANKSRIETQKKETKINEPKQESDHGLEKRSAEGISTEESKGKQLYPLSRNPNLDIDFDREFEKRTRMGFNGMRGKKEFSLNDYCAKIMRTNPESHLDFNKRFLRSFSRFGDKRAPIAFHGMRGKKSDDYDNELIEPIDLKNREFLVSSGLIEDSGLEFPELRERKDDEILSDEAFDKRSPYSFQGMRGKKENQYDLKRAMGFLGMRGKKATEIWDMKDENYKRVPQTSFFGVKGKKAQSSGFFGMRGKKASTSPFLEIKENRDPLDYDFQDLSAYNQIRESESSRNRFRRGTAWLNNSKKAKNAFFGLRGKKSTQERPEITFRQFE